MLIQFSVTNYKSFKDKSTLSLVASGYDKDTREQENVTPDKKYDLRLLKSSVLYGANASGKSKFIEAFIFMRHFMLNSSKETQQGEHIPVDPFRLNSESINQGSEFEIIFRVGKTIYRYGFEVTRKAVKAEWLFSRTKLTERELFYRDELGLEANTKKIPKAAVLIKEDLVRDNSLFLSVLAQFNDELAEAILAWVENSKSISGLKEESYFVDTMRLANNSIQQKRILSFLKNADIGIDDFMLKKFNNAEIESLLNNPNVHDNLKVALKGLESLIEKRASDTAPERFTDVITFHKQYNNQGEVVGDITFSLNDDESSGTRKFFALIGQIIRALDAGTVLFVDELDSKIHPNLVCKIIFLFNSKLFNPKNAQLIFNTHDTNLLSAGLFRRDQIWFVKKDQKGCSSLYSLADFKTDEVRKNEAFEPNYIRGKYGAIPFLGTFEDVFFSNTNTNATTKRIKK